jgi:hypothetical protein
VTIEDGPTVYVMCAIDALGMAAMLGRGTTISSTDPISGAPLRVTVRNGHARWEQRTAVVFVGSKNTVGGSAADCRPPGGDRPGMMPAEDRCCGVLNFFTDPGTAQAWIGRHPHVMGSVSTHGRALRLGVETFGHLLDD